MDAHCLCQKLVPVPKAIVPAMATEAAATVAAVTEIVKEDIDISQ